jgi:THO complex subunit 3
MRSATSLYFLATDRETIENDVKLYTTRKSMNRFQLLFHVDKLGTTQQPQPGKMAALFMSPPAPSASPLRLASYTCTEGGPHRTSSRTLSWNASGSFLALGGSDRVARIFAVDTSGSNSSSASGGGAGAGVREVLVISHASPVTKVRFNPSSATQIVTAAADKSVRLWDVRGATQRSLGSLTLVSGNAPVSLEWCPARPHLLCVTEQDGTISLYDVRAINSGSSSSSSNSSATTTSASISSALPSKLRPRPGALASISTGDDFPESCIFSPCGRYLLSDCNVDGSGRIRIWKCDDLPNASKDEAPTSVEAVASYPSHAPIYAMGFSPDQSTLVTGGADSVVGLWDRPTMICRAVVARHAKLIRSVSFTPDSRIVATATEELVDLADALDGSLIAQVSSSGHKVGSTRHIGAEEVAFQPNALSSSSSSYVLACARSDNPLSPTPLSVLRLNVAEGSGGTETHELQ